MIPRAVIDPTRTTAGAEDSQYNVDDGVSEVQRGYFQRPQFYGNHDDSADHADFSSAVSMASSFISMVSSILPPTSPTDRYCLTKAQYNLLQQIAASMATYGNIPVSAASNFLLILCYVNQLEDMIVIANAIQIPELADQNILRKPDIILNISNLHRAAFCANAIDGLVNSFKKYITGASTAPEQSNDASSILSTLSSILGGMGGLDGITSKLANSNSSDVIGHFMSELITGKRIPMTVIAKNPNLQAPSYAGKAFFGEAPTALSNIDIKQLNNKKIACFPKPSSGGGVTSFGIQNIGSIGSAASPIDMVAKMVFGSIPEDGTKKFRQLTEIMGQVRALTGCKDNENIVATSSEVAIPIMSALSTVSSGTDKPIFSNDVFQEGWILSNSITHHIKKNDPQLSFTMSTLL